MSTVSADKVRPQSGTSLQLGESGDDVSAGEVEVYADVWIEKVG